MPELKAIIFDFDGVLADTEPLHFRMFQTVLAEEGLPLTPEDYADKYVGLTDEACFEAILAAHGSRTTSQSAAELVARKTTLMQAALKTHKVLAPGVTDFVTAASRRYRLAVASGALRDEIELILGLAHLRHAFEQITAAQDVANGKPDPDLYLLTLHRLNERAPLAASECLAIEDTPHGIRAARAAGIRCLAVATTLPLDQLGEATAVTPTLAQCDLASLVQRLWR
ncbi:MAG: HAD family hydrolase [Nitrospiraceae bacterium]